MGVTPIHFEQPVHRDYCGCLHDVSIATMDKYRVVFIDVESCQSLFDAQKIIHGNLAHVIEPEKSGFADKLCLVGQWYFSDSSLTRSILACRLLKVHPRLTSMENILCL
ncbi:hypothetical protein QYE76_025020 [Lolium multiflorum]|uniref:Uncharacterized protein n=1 Tax=Lolium multiflorum TaxID=4521 RepID=A0AAD8VWK9_LOLMU|nr:hypothetical protein QYE76_025017 [Lolium multiflorum]KAK1619503.1 hypothetical protein QYE76_025020 [Lolium multiflorum]